MSGKRVLALYGALLFCFAAVVCRLYWLCSDTAYGARAAAQSVVTLHLPPRRGNFYDYRGQLLTGQTTRWMALCVPGEGSYARLFAYTDAAGQAALYQKRNAASPFLLEVDRDVSALGVSCWPAARRSSAAPLAVQLLGYLDGEGHGAAGLEAAFDELLTGSGAGDTLLCTVNAQGKLRAEPVLTPADSGAVGVQLTLSREIQQTAEAVANETMQSGCILVLDTANAKVRACVSRPGYDPENISASLNAPDSPLLERAFQCYAVGSVFKPVVAAAALEAGESGFVYTCPGWCAVDGRIFRCAGGIPHGEVDLAGALEKSCNGYFIRLGAGAGGRCCPCHGRAVGLRAGDPAHRCPAHGGWGPAGAGGSCVQRGLRQFLLWAGGAAGIPPAGRRHDEHHCLRGDLPHPAAAGDHSGRDHRRAPHGAFPCPEQAGAYKAHRRRPAGPVGGCSGRGHRP